MSLLPTVTSPWSAMPAHALERLRAAGNANSSRTLDDENPGDEALRRNTQSGRRRSDVSRIGTESAAPLWNGPRLAPAFVAQVLGQVMMDARDQALDRALPAYRRGTSQIPNGSFFDGDI